MSRSSRSVGIPAAVLILAFVLPRCVAGHHEPPAARVTAAPSQAATPATPRAAPPAPRVPPSPRSGLLPRPDRVDGGDPTAVSRAAITTMWTLDATVDAGQHDAGLRAVPYLTPEYAARLRAAGPGAPPPDEWRARRVHTRVDLRLGHDDGAPPDTAASASRQWVVTVTPVGSGGWTGDRVRMVAFVSLTRASSGGPWRVADVTTT